MFLKRAILVNWGNIPKIELDFGPVNLFSGGNGSGKTTAADAIQALLTAAHENLFAFNPGQDETTQRGRGGKQVRTLASYLLGCDDGSYSRPFATDGYVAGVFHPTQGEIGECFTAVMAMRGHLEQASQPAQARLDDVFFLVVPGEELSLTHFVSEFADGEHLVPINDIVNLIKKRAPAANVEVYDKKGAYLRRLYGALRGKRDAVSDREAKHAARTLSGFMAYKPVKSIHDFVAQEILEPKDLGEAIRNVSDLMKTIHEMEANASAIKASVAVLENARKNADDYLDHWVQRECVLYSAASFAQWRGQKAYIDAKTKQKATQDSINELKKRSALALEQKAQLHERIVSLEAQRQGVAALREKDALQQAIEKNHHKLVSFAEPLRNGIQQLHVNVDRAQSMTALLKKVSIGAEFPALEKASFRQRLKSVASNQEASSLDAHQLLNRDWIDISPLEAILAQVIGWESLHNSLADWLKVEPSGDTQRSLLEALYQLVEAKEAETKRYTQTLRQIEKELLLLESEQVNYPYHVEQAVQAIKHACPGADPKVLCDYVDVTEAHWQMAIEGYVGGARFAIIVEPEFEAEAIRVVRAMKGAKRNNAKIIQGQKAARDAARIEVSSDSIISVMTFSHRTAEDYLRASYGSVKRVDTAETLKNTARGITPEGLAAGNYSLWRCDIDDSQLVFGQGARARAAQAKRVAYDECLLKANEAKTALDSVKQLVQLVADIDTVSVSGLLQEMLTLQREGQRLESELKALDLGESQSLDNELSALRQDYQNQERENNELEQTLGGAQEKLKQAERVVGQLAAEQEKLEASKEDIEQQVQEIAKVLPRFEAEAELEARDLQVQNLQGDAVYDEELATLSRYLQQTERTLYENVMTHNQAANPEDAIVYDVGYEETHSFVFFKHVTKLRSIIESLHNRLKNNILVDKHRQLIRLKESFNTAFITNLCHSIYQAINEGEAIIDDLNKELQGHHFGADREIYYFGMSWVSEFEEYWQFFKALINLPNLGDGTTLFDAELKPKLAKVRDRLMSMLLDKDELSAHRELARISDYRNYRRYEIYKQPENKAPIALSQYGTGSGGQLETPAYIIRSAAVTSAFRFNEGRAHMRMVMVDEAFSKMDEGRSREVINYLTDKLGLQLIFIMPTSKSGPFLDLISNQFVFTKCPTTVARGELKTRVLVDRKQCNSDNIKTLWAKHRKVIRDQATLDFMEGIEV